MFKEYRIMCLIHSLISGHYHHYYDKLGHGTGELELPNTYLGKESICLTRLESAAMGKALLGSLMRFPFFGP